MVHWHHCRCPHTASTCANTPAGVERLLPMGQDGCMSQALVRRPVLSVQYLKTAALGEVLAQRLKQGPLPHPQ